MTTMQRATEAGAMNDASFDGREWMSMSRADRQRYLDRALSTVKTTLPILAEELIAWHDEQAARLYAEINAIQADGGWVDSHRQSNAEGHTAAASALRARVQSMMEEG
jgi:hypothetical protein